MASPKVVLDANILIPAAIRDTLLRAAEYDLYEPRWSHDILTEVERNLVDHGMATSQSARRLIQMMTLAFPASTVTEYSAIIDELPVNAKDRHVLAAAIAAGSQIIVTENLRDFPAPSLHPWGIQAQSCDAFLRSLFDRAPVTMTRIIREQTVALRDPPASVDNVLDSIALTAPGFAELVRQRIKDS